MASVADHRPDANGEVRLANGITLRDASIIPHRVMSHNRDCQNDHRPTAWTVHEVTRPGEPCVQIVCGSCDAPQHCGEPVNGGRSRCGSDAVVWILAKGLRCAQHHH